MSLTSLVLTALAGLGALFAGLFWLARRINNYGVVDVAWAYAFALLAAFAAATGRGWLPRRLLVASLVIIWSLRLGTHLARRVAAHHPAEDGRYVQLRRDWTRNFAVKMFGFFQLQAVSVLLLGLPFLLPALNPLPRFHWLEFTGTGLWLLALGGEALADAQLTAFKRDPANRGQVCAAGLWRYSRHPNYFFEWLVWVAGFVLALASPGGWAAVSTPALMLFLLLRVTGIPLTEQQLLRSKGEAYRRYQHTTSVFVPWPPRNPTSPASA